MLKVSIFLCWILPTKWHPRFFKHAECTIWPKLGLKVYLNTKNMLQGQIMLIIHNICCYVLWCNKTQKSVTRFNESILGDKDCENVYELVYSSQRQVAQAAGEFLNQKLFRRDDEVTRTLKIHKGKKQSLNAPLIRDLVQFFIESEVKAIL